MRKTPLTERLMDMYEDIGSLDDIIHMHGIDPVQVLKMLYDRGLLLDMDLFEENFEDDA